MSLKGYEWLVKGKPVMAYRFKDLTIILYQDIKQVELDKFKTWLAKGNHEVSHIETWKYKVI